MSTRVKYNNYFESNEEKYSSSSSSEEEYVVVPRLKIYGNDKTEDKTMELKERLKIEQWQYKAINIDEDNKHIKDDYQQSFDDQQNILCNARIFAVNIMHGIERCIKIIKFLKPMDKEKIMFIIASKSAIDEIIAVLNALEINFNEKILDNFKYIMAYNKEYPKLNVHIKKEKEPDVWKIHTGAEINSHTKDGLLKEIRIWLPNSVVGYIDDCPSGLFQNINYNKSAPNRLKLNFIDFFGHALIEREGGGMDDDDIKKINEWRRANMKNGKKSVLVLDFDGTITGKNLFNTIRTVPSEHTLEELFTKMKE